MKNLLRLLALAPLLAPSSFAQGPSNPHIDMRISEFRVAETSTDHIRVGVHVSVRTAQRASIARVAIDRVFLNGMPAFLSPVEESFEVAPNEFIQLPGELTATLYYRDLDNPDPIEQLVRDGSVTMDGEATITAKLNLAEAVATLSRTAALKTPVHAVVPVTLPGGELGRSAALLALRTARPLFGAARKALPDTGIGPHRDPWIEEVARKFQEIPLYVVTRYQLRDKDGTITDFAYSGTGFKISGSHFVVPREALEPWSFNPEAIARIKTKGAEVVFDSKDIFVFSPGERLDFVNQGRSLRKGDFRLIAAGREDSEKVVVKSKKGFKRASLETRGHGRNIAVLAFTLPQPISADPKLAMDSDSLDPMAILRFATPKPGELLQVEPIAMHCTRRGDTLDLADPVDARSFGAPVMVSSGIIAVVQDEHSAAPLKPALKRAGYALSD